MTEKHTTPRPSFLLEDGGSSFRKTFGTYLPKVHGIISQIGVTFIATTVRNYLVAQVENFKIRQVFITRRNTGYWCHTKNSLLRKD
jgi:hypothetical protein